MKKILIVEDDKAINNLIEINLKITGFLPVKAFDGKEALELISNEKFDLILLDVMIPYIDGFELAKIIRDYNIPIIFLTAKNSINDKLKGFDLNCYDYVVKPFDMIELIARIKAVFKHYNLDIEENIIKIRDIEIDFDKRVVKKSNEVVELSLMEFNLLEMLVKNKNIALSRERILTEVWGYDYYGDSRTVDVHIQKLRSKLSLFDEIKTIYKVGYRLEVERWNLDINLY